MFYLQPRKNSRVRTNASAKVNPAELFRGFDDIFNHFFVESNPQPSRSGAHWGGQVRETEKDVTISLDAPGFEAGEFEIQANEEAVTIVAEHKVKEGDEERTERSLKRQATFPAPVDPNKVEAKYRNGVLELRFQKAEQATWRKIEVKSE